MSSMTVPATGVDELVLRLHRVASRIAGADYSGAMQSLRYWDCGYDLGPLPGGLLHELRTHSHAARLCLANGDAPGASDHVSSALALASSAAGGRY